MKSAHRVNTRQRYLSEIITDSSRNNTDELMAISCTKHELSAENAVGSASAIIAAMTDRTPPRSPVPIRTVSPFKATTSDADDKVLCERCGAEMLRMHAV